MGLFDYYDRQGNEISETEWSRLYRSEYKIVAKTHFDGAWVSTVWLGTNHNYGEGSPVIFETMIFASTDEYGDMDNFCERYSTEEEAVEGHYACCQRVIEKDFQYDE